MSDKIFNPPDDRRTIEIRILSRRNGQVRFGDSDEGSSWVETPEEARKVAKEAAARQSEDPNDLQVRITTNHKNGEIHEYFSDQATNLHKPFNLQT